MSEINQTYIGLTILALGVFVAFTIFRKFISIILLLSAIGAVVYWWFFMR